MPLRRAPSCATGPRFPTSGADRIRTGDLSRARGALSQLSYGPTGILHFIRRTWPMSRSFLGFGYSWVEGLEEVRPCRSACWMFGPGFRTPEAGAAADIPSCFAGHAHLSRHERSSFVPGHGAVGPGLDEKVVRASPREGEAPRRGVAAQGLIQVKRAYFTCERCGQGFSPWTRRKVWSRFFGRPKR